MEFIIKIVIAHIIGDFVLQPYKWVEEKTIKSYRSKYFYLHGLVHLILLLFILGFKQQYWPVIIIIVISHLVFDYLKSMLRNSLSSLLLFLGDQLLHLFVIGLIGYLLYPNTIELDQITNSTSQLFLAVILTLIFVGSVFMKVFMSRWDLIEYNSENSLDKAGMYIGILERLFVFGFVLLNQWEGIGLLIAAKSVFRFNDLSKANDRKLTEYILIGTLTSFGFAIVTALLFQYFNKLL